MDGAPDADNLSDAIPRAEPLSKRGNPPFYEVNGKRYYTLGSAEGYAERGIASWYGPDFHGKLTSNGEVYDMHAMTAAHKTLPLPCYARVTNLNNGKSVVVRINDRGPFHGNRLIDLSYSAARKLDIVAPGTGLVEVRTLSTADTPRRQTALAASPAAVYIQVGAFSNRGSAERMLARLSEIPAAVRISEATAATQALYRVRIGPLARVEDVDDLSERINSLGIDTYVVVE
jgi:rare lipoprotein A